ncbi:hypothetical protein [Gallaecimonas pentaromativorans]|uniref:hypothetical protein n=1 Tax=Gallaecimonas pentaromativorans TaxID=584787 RepID=UPI003A8CDA50
MLSVLLLASQMATAPVPYRAKATRVCEMAVRARLGMVRTDAINVEQRDLVLVVSGKALVSKGPVNFICQFTIDERDQLQLTHLDLLALKQDPKSQ